MYRKTTRNASWNIKLFFDAKVFESHGFVSSIWGELKWNRSTNFPPWCNILFQEVHWIVSKMTLLRFFCRYFLVFEKIYECSILTYISFVKGSRCTKIFWISSLKRNVPRHWRFFHFESSLIPVDPSSAPWKSKTTKLSFLGRKLI